MGHFSYHLDIFGVNSSSVNGVILELNLDKEHHHDQKELRQKERIRLHFNTLRATEIIHKSIRRFLIRRKLKRFYDDLSKRTPKTNLEIWWTDDRVNELIVSSDTSRSGRRKIVQINKEWTTWLFCGCRVHLN